MPSRKVMARKRTRPSQGSHSLTLVAGFILFSLPVPLNSPAGSFFEDKNNQRAASSGRFVARSARFKTIGTLEFSDRQVFRSTRIVGGTWKSRCLRRRLPVQRS